ncbi:MAG: sulfate reduction electron transfer complex DsrMKJOP subunit DsrJ [Desulfobacterales bacterium]|nr:sulfate reduction electron transfer complex DsrMKJOP subunit DsrJ [Desulfobacterales bacterium]
MPSNKKIYNKGLILAGLAVFLIVVTSPFWGNFGTAAPVPELILTEKAKAAKTCVFSKEAMKTEHMQLLDVWRDTVVRDGKRVYVNSDGKSFNMSLSNGCLDCHSNKAEFCDRCHNYASVTPYCWDCHIDKPKES